MNLKIFIADDDEDDLSLLNDVLSEILNNNSFGFTLHTASNGVELMDQLKKEGKLPQILFLDINMPLKDGLACLSEIKGHDQYKQIIVIILSTSTHHTSIRRAYENGADLYISKQSNYRKFKEIIANCFSSESKFYNRLFQSTN